MRVLIVECGPGLHGQLRDRLRDSGVGVTVAGSVADALASLERSSFDVVIVDVMLPDGSGLDVLDEVRRAGSKTHVIMMSASASEGDRTEATQRGADDYVLKPLLVRELTTRVLAVRRRGNQHRDQLLRAGALTIDLRARRAHMHDRRLDLTAREFDLLAYLVARPGHVFSRDELLRAVWQSTTEWQQPATVTEHIRRLRVKIETEPRRPRILLTVRGAGYRLDIPEDHGSGAPREIRLAPGTVIHIDGRIVHADQAAGVMFDLHDQTDLVGRQISELVSPASRAATRERMADGGPGPQRRTQLIDVERLDGTEISVEVTSNELDWKGESAQEVGFTHVPDLSARLRRLVTGVLSELTDAVIITDLHFHVRSWNRAAERLYGWKQHEVLGRHILDVIQWVGDDGALAAIWDNLERTGRWKADGRQATRDGSVISVLACTTLVRNDSGEPVAIVSVNRPTPDAIGDRCAEDTSDDDQIRIGLANDEFEVYYQPVVALDDLRVVTLEALVRWNHPERGLLAPAAFISTAERCGSIVEIGNLVLEKACTQAAEWRRSGLDIELAVNLSARQLADPDLFDRVASVLAVSGLDPAKLWLEVTETSLVEEVDQASAVLHRFADIGIGIVIDDFGTGWASLTYLRTFPVHALKIDRSFIPGVGRNAHDTAIARSILALGSELGLHVIAEGIETPAQQKALQKLGCKLAQGYLFGHPSPASTASTLNARRIPPIQAGSVRTPVAPYTAVTGVARVPLHRTTTPIARLSIADILASTDGPSDTTVPYLASAEHEETDIATRLLKGLLRITSADDAAELLHEAIRQMGGRLVPGSQAGPDALPIDVSLGRGRPLFVTAERLSIATTPLPRLLAGMTDDARHAVQLLHQHDLRVPV
jgi:PAS domain S-box-containing protein